jgi:hypothetical protein
MPSPAWKTKVAPLSSRFGAAVRPTLRRFANVTEEKVSAQKKRCQEEKVSGTISLTKGVGNHFVGWGGRAAAGLSRGQIVAPCPPDRHRWRTTGRTGRRRATKRLLIPFPPVTGSLGQLPLEMRDDDLGENLLSPKPVVLEVQAVNITDLAIDDPTLDKIINGLPELLVDQEIGDQAP